MSPLTPQDSNNSENERQESPAEKALRKYRYAGSQRLRYDAAAKRYDQIEAAANKKKNAAQNKADFDRYAENAKRAKKSADHYKFIAGEWKKEELKWKGILDGLMGRNERSDNAPSQEHKPAAFQQMQPVTPDASPSLKSQTATPTEVLPTPSLYSQPTTGEQSNSLLVTRNDTQPVNTLVSPAPSVPDYEAQDARERKMLDNLYPNMGKPQLPPLVRRDGQELSTAEKMYPAMGYNEDEYEPWSDDAVAMAITKYPDVAKNESVARRLAAADPNPQPEVDEEEFRLPLNPTLTDLARHAQSKRKKLW